jgi:UDP-N-acetylmuramate--alanine ligase
MKGKCRVLSGNAVVDYIRETKPDLLLTMGAGDIDQLIEPIREALL